jgi:hypothetical protein
MDRNFHTDDFERLLREKSDEFRMYPSKRIWHSIYNNIHPGHKWPSVAMSITLISALFLMGYLNTRNRNQYSGLLANRVQKEKIIPPKATQDLALLNQDKNMPTRILAKQEDQNKPAFILNNNINTKLTNTRSTQISKHTQSGFSKKTTDVFVAVLSFKSDYGNPNKKSESESNIVLDNSKSKTINGLPVEEQSANPSMENVRLESYGLLPNDQPLQNTYLPETISRYNDDLHTDIIPNNNVPVIKEITPTSKEQMVALNTKDIITVEDKAWIENYALYNRPTPKKWANKLNWRLYATPSVVYRTLDNEANFGNTLNATPFAISTSGQNINASVNQAPSFGLELGTGLQYLILKGVKIKSGLQLNFTRYNSHAFQNSHPVATKLTMLNFETQSSYEVYRSTPYSNNGGLESTALHNETFQVSIPVGVDLKLIGNDRLQWNIGATIQPAFVAAGKSYLISSDKHNYVKESAMLNRWNLNAGFETFISYKVNGLTWEIGPQFRKQLFTTNSKTFAVHEKLLTYGLKFGISKTIK